MSEVFFSKRTGFPGWVWPALLTVAAVVERFLGGAAVKQFREMAETSTAFWSTMLFISLAGTLGNKAHKRILETKLGVPG